jgi:hypothetical protein
MFTTACNEATAAHGVQGGYLGRVMRHSLSILGGMSGSLESSWKSHPTLGSQSSQDRNLVVPHTYVAGMKWHRHCSPARAVLSRRKTTTTEGLNEIQNLLTKSTNEWFQSIIIISLYMKLSNWMKRNKMGTNTQMLDFRITGQWF